MVSGWIRTNHQLPLNESTAPAVTHQIPIITVWKRVPQPTEWWWFHIEHVSDGLCLLKNSIFGLWSLYIVSDTSLRIWHIHYLRNEKKNSINSESGALYRFSILTTSALYIGNIFILTEGLYVNVVYVSFRIAFTVPLTIDVPFHHLRHNASLPLMSFFFLPEISRGCFYGSFEIVQHLQI